MPGRTGLRPAGAALLVAILGASPASSVSSGLSTAQLRRLLDLTFGAADLTQGEQEGLREIVRLAGYAEDSRAKTMEPVTQLARGILMAYYFVDGVDFTAEAA